MIAALLSAALAASAAAPAQIFSCTLTTPRGDPIAFRLETKADGPGAAFLVPGEGSVWPASPLAGGGGTAVKKDGPHGAFYFGGGKDGVSLQIDGDKAQLFAAAGKAPRAYGFCLPGGAADPAAGSRMVAVDPGARIPAFDSAGWTESDCALLTRSGRRGRVDYRLIEGGMRSEIRSETAGFFAEPRALVERVQGSGGKPTRFGGARGLAGTERLVVDPKASEAVQLIDFTEVGTPPNPPEPAIAICGHAGIVRRPALQ
jgi:hypothetical protein